MGISVISSPTASQSAASSSNSASAGQGFSGEFASLLSGEILSLIASANLEKGAKLSGKPLNQIATTSLDKESKLPGKTLNLLATASFEKDPKLSADDSPKETINLLDPSLVTLQASNPALQAEVSTQGTISFQADAAKLSKTITDASANMLAAQSTTSRPNQSSEEAPDGAAFSAFEKLALSGRSSAQGNAPLREAANFAAEATAMETNTPPQPNSIGANLAARQPNEALATERANVSTHLREASWPQQFGEKIVWLAKSNQQSAQININPPELGPVQITLNLNGDQAKVVFASPHAEVRQAIESALPQLKEMLSSAGINLGQANVGSNLAQQNPDNPYRSTNAKHLTDENAILPANERTASAGTSLVLQRGRGLVDLFA